MGWLHGCGIAMLVACGGAVPTDDVDTDTDSDTDVDTDPFDDTDPFGLAGDHGPFLPCTAVVSDLAPDATTPLGVSTTALVAALSPTTPSPGQWSDAGDAVGVTLRLTTPRAVRFEARARADGQADVDGDCPDQLVFDASLTLRTTDEALSLAALGHVVATSTGDAVLLAALPLAPTTGTWTPAAALGETTWDVRWANAIGRWAGGDHLGWVEVGGASSDASVDLVVLTWAAGP
ncbi:MAG: hypothetical protein H6733_07685 [Alphaproteobacteria bacterium]|nr:hypothetical protein [Alphaproteobacteria bacterium]